MTYLVRLVFATFLLALLPQAHGADCSPWNITLSSQAEVDAFPGGCDRVRGTLTISGPDIENLDSLSALRGISGNFWLGDNPLLADISGLTGLTTLDRSLSILRNDLLTNVDALGALANKGPGFVEIVDNPALTNIDGLAQLTEIRGFLSIIGNAVLTDLGGLAGLQTVTGGLSLHSNDSLGSLDGLEALSSVGGNLRLTSNRNLSDIGALAGLTAVGIRLIVSSNRVLESLHGLEQLRSVGNDVTIDFNNQLTDCVAVIPLLDSYDDAAVGPGPPADPPPAGRTTAPDVGRGILIRANGGDDCASVSQVLASATPPVFSQRFSPAAISVDGVVTRSALQFTIDNRASTIRHTELAFDNTLPAGLALADPPNSAVTCSGATLSAAAGSAALSLSGGTVPAGSVCTVTIDVVAARGGLYTNQPGALTSTLTTSPAAAASLLVDDQPPAITLYGDNPLTLTRGAHFTDPGASATDARDGPVPVTVSGSVDTAAAGDYTLTYSAVDSLGNAAEVRRTVSVLSAPVEAGAPRAIPALPLLFLALSIAALAAAGCSATVRGIPR